MAFLYNPLHTHGTVRVQLVDIMEGLAAKAKYFPSGFGGDGGLDTDTFTHNQVISLQDLRWWWNHWGLRTVAPGFCSVTSNSWQNKSPAETGPKSPRRCHFIPQIIDEARLDSPNPQRRRPSEIMRFTRLHCPLRNFTDSFQTIDAEEWPWRD